MNAWLLLLAAGLLEIVWAVGLKYTAGFTRPLPTTITAVALLGSMVMLGLAVRTLPIGSAYAVWTGIGTVGTAIFGPRFAALRWRRLAPRSILAM
jgi:quaternary ammonium compound-resistance protein SugE